MTPPRIIADLGNSLTVQKAACRPALHQRLEQHWQAPLQQVNAGLGGVGSLACACLIESSAADMLGATSPGQIGPSLETSVRELFAAAVEPVLCICPGAAASLPNGRAGLELILGEPIISESAVCRSGIASSLTSVPCWMT